MPKRLPIAKLSLALPLALLLVACGGDTAFFVSTGGNPNIVIIHISSDTFSNQQSQHATEVEPGSFAFGPTIISSFQVGRIAGGGSSDIGFAISNDSGSTWQNGLLPGLTTFQGGGTNSAATDTSVIHDAKHGVWIISSLTIRGTVAAPLTPVVVSRSTDGSAAGSNPIV
jgi:hypothetical protein